jgi:hypothetical protein
MFMEMITVYCAHQSKPKNTLCGWDAYLLNIIVGFACSHHCTVKSFTIFLFQIKDSE